MMRYHTVCMLGLMFVVVFLTGCVSYIPRLENLSSVKPEEAIVATRIRIKYNGVNSKQGVIVIDDTTQYILDESGYMFAALPAGKHSITLLAHESGFLKHQFQPNELTFQLGGGGQINYLGDITLDWQGITPEEGRNNIIVGALIGSGGGVITAVAGGCVASKLTPQGKIVVEVKSDDTQIQKEFTQRFASDRKLTPSLLAVKFQP